MCCCTHWNCLGEVITLSTHIICFHAEIRHIARGVVKEEYLIEILGLFSLKFSTKLYVVGTH